MEANKRKMEQLKAKVTKLTETDGITIDEDLDKDLREIMMDTYCPMKGDILYVLVFKLSLLDFLY